MAGFLFVERWADKFILTSTWLDGIFRADCFTALFYSIFLLLAVLLVSWNAVISDDDTYESLDWI